MSGQVESAIGEVSDDAVLGLFRPAVRAWVEQTFGRPTAIQRAAWPALAAGKNVLLSAPTGAGKTLAAFLPLLDSLLDTPPTGLVRVLYVAPLKALVADVRRNLRRYLRGIRSFLTDPRPMPRVEVRTGDTAPRDREGLWRDPPGILLTTPESLAVLLTHAEAEDLFAGLRHVVVDEIHSLAAGKRGADLSLSLERLSQLRIADCGLRIEDAESAIVRVGLSATATPLQEAARYLVGVGRPCTVAAVADRSALELTIRPLTPGPAFPGRLLDLLGEELQVARSTLIFTNTRALAERVAWGLRRRHPEWDDQIAVHHSSVAADRRREVERRFKRGRLRAVVSSTSLELGIDVGTVDLVVLVHPPGDVVRLLQRVGRAGHAPGLPHRGLVLTSGPAELLEATVTAASGRTGQCEPLRVAEGPLDVLCQQLLGMAATRGRTPDDAFALVRRAHPYRDLSRADFDACLDYLSGTAGDWLPSRLRHEDGAFRLRDERTLRLLRRNLGTILADDPCEVVIELPADGGDFDDPPQRLVGHVDEVFAERLQPGDRFLLDGLSLEFRRLETGAGRGGAGRLVTTEAAGRPRVPRWAGDGWPMSPQLAGRLFVFRGRAAEALHDGPDALTALLRDEYDLGPEAAEELTGLLARQEILSEIPDPRGLLIEIVPAQSVTTCYLHTPLNRKANDALARVLSVRLARRWPGASPLPCLVADLGLAVYLRDREPTPDDFRELLSLDGFDDDLGAALADSLVLRERFRRVALTALMLLRNPLGRKRRVGGPDWGERRLFDQVCAARPDFILLRQAEREVRAEVCDADAAREYLSLLPRLDLRCRRLAQPSPLVEGWTQTDATVAGPLPTPEEVLLRLHAALNREA